MSANAINFTAITFGQGNDDVGFTATTPHVNSESEITALADVLACNGEFGQKMHTTTRYETVPGTVTPFTSTVKAKQRGRLKLSLIFESGKKGSITIADYFNDEDAITAMRTAILAKSAASWGAINSKVITVNAEFHAVKSA